jgi:serine/threonine protein kinase
MVRQMISDAGTHIHPAAPGQDAPMPHATVDTLVEALRGRPILSPKQFDELIRDHAPAHADTLELARTLIRLGWLTIYQAKKILSGKPEDLLIGQYVILDKLGEGGMGKVYKATQLSLNRVVALKIVRNSLLRSDTALKRFHREVRAAARLRHPNIVHVFDADHVGDRHFLCMEYIDGIDLAKLVKTRGSLPIATACSYVRQAALGLQHAHDHGMVHRDIKPGNLLVAADERGQYSTRNVVKILDMGLARSRQGDINADSFSTEITRAGTVIGTPDYMSPERAKNSSTVDRRSDLYSLGCTFYHLLTAEIPFPNGSPLEKLMQHQMDAPRPVQQLRADVPPEVATIVHCLLSKRPEDRFQSGAALAKALAPWTTGTALFAGPPPPAEAVDPLSEILESSHPFDFSAGADDVTPESERKAPSARRTVPTHFASKKRILPWIIILVAVFLAFLAVGAVAADMLLGRKKSEDSAPSPGRQDPPKGEPAKTPPAKAKPDPPPAKDLETAEKFLPDDASAVAIFDLKQWQGAPAVRSTVLAPLAEQFAPFRNATGVDLLSAVERVVVGHSPDNDAVVILQGRGLVTPRLVDGVKAMPGVRFEAAWNDGPELVIFGDEKSPQALYAASSETSVILSPQRRRVVEALEKRDSGKRTRIGDPTVARGLEYAYARPFAAFITIGLRQVWAKSVPAATKLNFAAAGIFFDDRGMYFHTLADETESGRAIELQRTFGRLLADKAKSSNPPDLRIERLAGLLLDAEPARLAPPKLRLTHTQHLVPTRKLEEWFAPFFPKGEG